jgi:hypothetical protein
VPKHRKRHVSGESDKPPDLPNLRKSIRMGTKVSKTDMLDTTDYLVIWDDDDILDYRPDSDGWDTYPEWDE